MLEILTPMSKLTRVSRRIDAANFLAVPGIWAKVNTTGGLDNISTGVPALGTRIVISNASSNVYESHDIEVGRITTVETPGVRCKVDTAGYVDSGNVAVGLDLVVSADSGEEGKLAVLADVANGTYEVVARAEEFDAVNNILTYLTMSPRTVVKT